MNTWGVLNQLRHGRIQQRPIDGFHYTAASGTVVPDESVFAAVGAGYADISPDLRWVSMTVAGENYWLENGPADMVGTCECPCHVEPRVAQLYPVDMQRAGSRLTLVCGVCRVAFQEERRRVQ